MEKVLGRQGSVVVGDQRRPKTKIVCTLGPQSRSVDMLERLLKAGMSVARFNFSHGTHAYHQETLNNLRTAMNNTGILCAVMLDTKGPEIRTGFLKDGKPVQLKQGQEILISTDYGLKGDENMICMSYKKLAEDVKPGSVILCSDGTISLRVLACDKENGLVHCRCENSAVWVENQEGVMNFDEILMNSDAFMVARGDLGMEIPIEKIFLAQKLMIHKANLQGKPVVTATQMLESMIKSPRPTRAEATDVANAVLDGTDCVMLSGETAAGAYPELAVQTMARICKEAEDFINYGDLFKRIMENASMPMSPLESLASSAVKTANSVKAAFILVLTRRGNTAKLLSKYRPSMPILSVVVPEIKTDFFQWLCSDETPARHSLIYRGLVPVLSSGSAGASHSESTEETIEQALQYAKEKGFCKPGDSIVVLHKIDIASVIKIQFV
ncbi:hypothetical protein GH714_001808 [Hevea brasiliensis]|uniref:Pyruvate kinase n=1 Tax=Hevea brasiliensis TaxID=3981 RepID=A0A6A6LC97_HEVBR|nr:hypothetical protein GH714_001808 [Hevea brasiliensis]